MPVLGKIHTELQSYTCCWKYIRLFLCFCSLAQRYSHHNYLSSLLNSSLRAIQTDNVIAESSLRRSVTPGESHPLVISMLQLLPLEVGNFMFAISWVLRSDLKLF